VAAGRGGVGPDAAGVGGALAAGCGRSFLSLGRPPADWSYDLAIAAAGSRDRLALPPAARIVKEAALPMSKIDPRTVAGARGGIGCGEVR
jgi:hypothetical protein